MEFRILGSVEVHDERTGLRIVPSGAKQRALLGALITKANRTVRARQLIDELWAQTPPANKANALQAHIRRLRRLLPPSPADEPQQEWITTGAAGYALRLGGAATDAGRFRRAALEGRSLLDRDPEQAARLLRRALACWRGQVLEGASLDMCAGEVAQLEEARLVALEGLYEACLRTGRHHEITSELTELTVHHPLRERFYDLLMVALYRCGRQADALSVYDRARARLAGELGIEPGPVLRGRLRAVLDHDPALDLPDRAGHSGRLTVARGPLLDAREPGALADAAAADGGDRALHCEIARLRRHLDRLTRDHQTLLRRFDQLTARPAGSR
ncbi:AfsR/SARP family transcriptional regulator [Streptomyces sp. B8F3]|uniref:AfsR/SARP family transcriptional regulator n=1 Tax=Streptomyces sp. B8F3 TaxID=3153573 RepID=UPI00325DD41E